MRNCRICLQQDICNNFNKCFDFNGNIVADIYALFHITIVSLKDNPAIICRKCEKHIGQAIELKKFCIAAEQYFKEVLTNQRYIWNENLRELKATTSKNLSGKNDEIQGEVGSKDLNDDDLDEFLREADDVLMKSLDNLPPDILELASSNASSGTDKETNQGVAAPEETTLKEPAKEPAMEPVNLLDKDARNDCGVVVKTECTSLADTDILHENLDDRIATDFNDLDDMNLTQEDLIRMTAAIEEILPKEDENLRFNKVPVNSNPKDNRLVGSFEANTLTVPAKVKAARKTQKVNGVSKKRGRPVGSKNQKKDPSRLTATKIKAYQDSQVAQNGDIPAASQVHPKAAEKPLKKIPIRRESILRTARNIKNQKLLAEASPVDPKVAQNQAQNRDITAASQVDPKVAEKPLRKIPIRRESILRTTRHTKNQKTNPQLIEEAQLNPRYKKRIEKILGMSMFT